MSSPNRYGSQAIKSLQVAVSNLQGEFGITHMSGATIYSGQWKTLLALSDATFTILDVPANDGASLTGMTLLTTSGPVSLGLITRIQLAGGTVIAYK